MTRLILLAAVWMLPACFGPRCDSGGMDLALKAISSAPDDVKVKVLLAGMDEACSGTSLDAAYKASPDMRQSLMASAIQSDPSAWNAACPAGTSVLEKMAVAPAEDKPGIAFQDCDLQRLGLDRATVDAWGDEVLYRVVAVGLAQSLGEAQRGQVMAILKTAPASQPQ